MFLERLKLKKILSFNEAEIELRQLNVLIGPNAAGKSNLIEVIGLLQATPTSLWNHILRGQTVRQWFWLGDAVQSPIATIGCIIKLHGRDGEALGYELRISEDSGGFVVVSEQLASGAADSKNYFMRTAGRVTFSISAADLMQGRKKSGPTEIPRMESVLALSKSPIDPTPITELGNSFVDMRILRELRTGPDSPIRRGITTTARRDSLMDGGDNLPLVLQNRHVRNRLDTVVKYLRRFCERFEDVRVDVGEGLARILFKEAGLAEMLSAVRMSDGTLKFLSILAALFDPSPPPLLCIEEPEIGLHPDAMQLIAEALIEASRSVQLIVTTHSEALVSALSSTPESVLVCERDFDNGTQMKRLSKKDLAAWLDRYSLGELWIKGEIGGVR